MKQLKRVDLFKKWLSEKQGEKSFCENSISDLQTVIDDKLIFVDKIERGVAVLQVLVTNRHKDTVERFKNTVTTALQDIFCETYEFNIKFGIRNKSTTASLEIHTGEYKGFTPLRMCQGKGVKEIVSFILRIVFVAILHGENIIILDECLTGLEFDNQFKAGVLLNRISKEFGIQIIMVSHVKPIYDSADNKIMIGD